MNTKNFKLISNLLTWFFRVMTILSMVGVVVTLGLFIFGGTLLEKVSYQTNFNYLFNIMTSLNDPGKKELARPDILVTSVLFATMTYVSIQASSLFAYLLSGKSPFNNEFAGKIKKISKVLIIADLTIPILRSLIITLFTSATYYIHIGFSWKFIVGLLLYIFSGILYYGVSLQELSDETV